jgi:hypothetical protein
MPAIAPQPVQISCPNCRTPFRTGIYSLVDAGEQPELKQALLAGQLNLAICPNCGVASALGAPLVYHDAAKQLCFVYFPQELRARPEEQERFVGDVTNFLIKNLPAEIPRGYLLKPRRFISQTSLIEAIFESDGVSKEMLDAQRARVALIAEFAQAMEDEAELARLAEQHRAELDYDFFATLTAFADANAQQGRMDGAEMLTQLRDRLASLAGVDLPDNPDDLAGPSDAEYEAELTQAVERLVSASDEELEALVGELRGDIDYGFFELWTQRIDEAEAAGNAAEAERLAARRTRILEVAERLDQQAQAMFEAGNEVLRAVLDAPDLAVALREQGDKVDEGFLMVASANAEAARHIGNAELAQQLEQIVELAMAQIEERMTPEDRFLNQLLATETPQESTKILRRSFAQITPALVQRANELADQADGRGNKPTADRLRQIGREASAMLF